MKPSYSMKPASGSQSRLLVKQSVNQSMGSTPGGDLPHYNHSDELSHSSASDDEKQYDSPYSPFNDHTNNAHDALSNSHTNPNNPAHQDTDTNTCMSNAYNDANVQQIQCFACLRMNDPNLMFPHDFIHPSYFSDPSLHAKSLCVSCRQCMSMDGSISQSNSHLVYQSDWTVDPTDHHYRQCSGCGMPSEKNVVCEICPAIFCDACIRSFGGPKLWYKVENVDHWECLLHERSPEWTNECDLFTVPHVRCRLERGAFTSNTAINPLPYSRNVSSCKYSDQLQSLLMVAGLTYHTPLIKRKLAYHVHDVAELAAHLRDKTLRSLQAHSSQSVKSLRKIPDPLSEPVRFSKPLKLISVSLYHQTGCRPNEHRRYLVGLMKNLETFTSTWPGWTVRIYYDSSMLIPAASPLDNQDPKDPHRVIQAADGTLTIASSQKEFVWDHSKYTSHVVNAWQTFMSWARDQKHIQLCYFNWPHLQDHAGFHFRHTGMLARFLALADIGVTATHVVIADLDNIWTKKAYDLAENFDIKIDKLGHRPGTYTARFHRFCDESYRWNVMGGGFSVRWPENELNSDAPENAPFGDIETAMHEFAQAHFSAPHEFFNQYGQDISASSRPIGREKKKLHSAELNGCIEDELFGYCVDQAFLDRYVWVRMSQFDRKVIMPGWIATTPSRIQNVPVLPHIAEATLRMQKQNRFSEFFGMLTEHEWPACYHLDSLQQGALEWQFQTIDEWMKRQCTDISKNQSGTVNWQTSPFDAKDASAPFHYYSPVVNSRVRMVNSLIDYLGRLTNNSYNPFEQHFSHHPFVGLPSLSSTTVQAEYNKRDDQSATVRRVAKHDWVIQSIHEFLDDKRCNVQKSILNQQRHDDIVDDVVCSSASERYDQVKKAPSSSKQPVFDAVLSFSQSLQQSSSQPYSDVSQSNDFLRSASPYDHDHDDDHPEDMISQSTDQSISHSIKPSNNLESEFVEDDDEQLSARPSRRRFQRAGSPHAKRFRCEPEIDLVESESDETMPSADQSINQSIDPVAETDCDVPMLTVVSPSSHDNALDELNDSQEKSHNLHSIGSLYRRAGSPHAKVFRRQPDVDLVAESDCEDEVPTVVDCVRSMSDSSSTVGQSPPINDNSLTAALQMSSMMDSEPLVPPQPVSQPIVDDNINQQQQSHPRPVNPHRRRPVRRVDSPHAKRLKWTYDVDLVEESDREELASSTSQCAPQSVSRASASRQSRIVTYRQTNEVLNSPDLIDPDRGSDSFSLGRWTDGWSVPEVVQPLVNQSTNQSISPPVSQLAKQAINQPVNQSMVCVEDPSCDVSSISQSINHPINQPINQPIKQSVRQPVKQPIDQSTSWFKDHLRDVSDDYPAFIIDMTDEDMVFECL